IDRPERAGSEAAARDESLHLREVVQLPALVLVEQGARLDADDRVVGVPSEMVLPHFARKREQTMNQRLDRPPLLGLHERYSSARNRSSAGPADGGNAFCWRILKYSSLTSAVGCSVWPMRSPRIWAAAIRRSSS